MMTAKSSVDSVRKVMITDMEISFPEYGEQKKIANMIREMEDELKEIERKIEKYKFIKQGMMQELLTGKRRLI